jgi:prophage DNA circulation protein
MTFDQRYDRLQKSGGLMDWKDVRDQSGIPNPTRRDIVEASEKKEQEAREKSAQEIDRARIKVTDFALAIATGTGVWAAMPSFFEKLGTKMVEARRDLAKFSGTIAMAQAKLDVGDIRRRRATAQATRASGASLASSLNDLRNELAPAKNALMTFLNTGGVALIKAATVMVKVGFPALKAIETVAAWTEKSWFGDKKGDDTLPAFKLVRDTIKGNLNNKKPNAPEK